MKPEVQWFLVEELANARAHLGLLDDYEAKQRQLTHFGGVLAALHYTEAISQEEQQIWNRKMLVALGYDLPQPAGPGVAQAIYVGDPAKRPKAKAIQKAPVFIRSLPGPDREYEIYGGKLRVIGVELYDHMLSVRWRVSPEPDITFAFPEETAALEQDLVGLEDWSAAELRRKGFQKLEMMRLYQFGLSDDVGTTYIQTGSGHRSGGNERTGDATFQVPPPEASELTFSWLGLEVRIPLN